MPNFAATEGLFSMIAVLSTAPRYFQNALKAPVGRYSCPSGARQQPAVSQDTGVETPMWAEEQC